MNCFPWLGLLSALLPLGKLRPRGRAEVKEASPCSHREGLGREQSEKRTGEASVGGAGHGPGLTAKVSCRPAPSWASATQAHPQA